jgi:hypothetical protein
MMQVCKFDGVKLVRNRLGRWLHIDEIPRGVEDHEPEPIDSEAYELALAEDNDVKTAALAMLRHHDVLCPGCEFRAKLRRALGMPE